MITPRRFVDEVVSDEMAAVLRMKTPAERLAIAFGMWRFASAVVRGSIRREHPEMPEDRLAREVARRMSHGSS